ncbi:MAG: hypothetical protein U1E77_20325 [Inhella sp.]
MQEMVNGSGRMDREQAMQTPEDVQAMLKLASLGWGAKRISPANWAAVATPCAAT